MTHVSALLPYNPSDEQKLDRKVLSFLSCFSFSFPLPVPLSASVVFSSLFYVLFFVPSFVCGLLFSFFHSLPTPSSSLILYSFFSFSLHFHSHNLISPCVCLFSKKSVIFVVSLLKLLTAVFSGSGILETILWWSSFGRVQGPGTPRSW
jgi:hypothetical protein